jgi:hypothetical protein
MYISKQTSEFFGSEVCFYLFFKITLALQNYAYMLDKELPQPIILLIRRKINKKYKTNQNDRFVKITAVANEK